MLIRLLPEQASAAWDSLAPAIQMSLPPLQAENPLAMVNLLEAILAERVTVWQYLTDEEPQRTKGLVVTTIYTDPVLYTSHLLIYAIVAFEVASPDEWRGGFETLRTYAAGMNLVSIFAYSKEAGVIRMCVDRLGAIADYALIEMVL